MDYSLLLGVHYRAPQHLQSHLSYHRRPTGDRLAILSEEGEEFFDIKCSIQVILWF